MIDSKPITHHFIIPRGTKKNKLLFHLAKVAGSPFKHKPVVFVGHDPVRCPQEGLSPHKTTPAPRPDSWIPVLIKWPSPIVGTKWVIFWRTQLAYKCRYCGIIWGPRNRDFTGLEIRTDDHCQIGSAKRGRYPVIPHDRAAYLQN